MAVGQNVVSSSLLQDGSRASTTRLIASADLFEMAAPRAPEASPNGKELIYLNIKPDIFADRVLSRLCRIDLATGEETELYVPALILAARWLPDGSILIVRQENAESERAIVERKYSKPDSVQRIASIELTPSVCEPSPDGRFLAFIARIPMPSRTVPLPKKPKGATWSQRARRIEQTVWRADGIGELNGANHIFLIDLHDGSLKRLTEIELSESYFTNGLSWSSDCRKIYFSSNLDENWASKQFDLRIYSLDIVTKQIVKLTEREGPDFDPKISPDGKWIAYRGFDDNGRFHEVINLYLMQTSGAEARLLAAVGQDIGAHAWSVDGNFLYFTYVQDGTQQIAQVDREGSIVVLAKDIAPTGDFEIEPTMAGSADIAPVPDGVITTLASASDPGQLVLLLANGSARQLTALNADLRAQMARSEAQSINYVSPDGTELQAWIFYPPDYDPSGSYPLILEVHGGPDLAYGGYFSFRFQRYLAEGYVVLAPNYRGSLGTPMSFYEDSWRFPGAEYDDLMAGVDAALKQAAVDPDRLFVTGLSAGGLLTAWIIGKTDRFAAAAVQAPVINWISHSLTHDLYSSYVEREFSKPPWEDPMSYWSVSPLSLIGNVSTPTLIVQGECDLRTPSSEAVQLYQALHMRGVDCALLLLPDAPHTATRPVQWIEEQEHMLEWFASHDRKTGLSSG